MPYASPAFRREQSVQRFVAPSKSATAEINRVVARVHKDLDKQAARDAWAATVAFAKQGEIGPPKIKSASI